MNFEKKEYETALELTAKINYTFFVFKFEAKVLTLKLYYELKLPEQAFSLTDSFSHFLSKNRRVSERYKEPFMNFIKYLKILFRNYGNNNLTGYDLKEMKKTLSALRYVISKRWIIDKIEEFET